MTDVSITPASLEDPLYYLQNAKSVWSWVLSHHRDLLLQEEFDALSGIFDLPEAAQALLTRMVMRRRDLFPVDKLQYLEIPDLGAALSALAEHGYIEQNPEVSIQELCHSLTKSDVHKVYNHMFETRVAPSTSKTKMVTQLGERYADRVFHCSEWGVSDRWIYLKHRSSFQLFQLMFFGNLHQDWSEFVTTELGHTAYEKVSFSGASRAFQSRNDIDTYCYFHQLVAQSPEALSLTEFDRSLLSSRFSNPWLEKQRQRSAYQLAQYFEKQADYDNAIQLYHDTQGNSSSVRYLRVLEKTRPADEVIIEAERLLQTISHEATRTLLNRVWYRAHKKLGGKKSKTLSFQPDTVTLQLPHSNERVEHAVARHVQSPHYQVFYTENHLIPALWALLYWPLIYSEQTGAFFHPFQSAPADFYHDDFLTRRNQLKKDIDATIANGDYIKCIKTRYREKYGLSNPLVTWHKLNKDLLDLSLSCIPANQLKVMFQYLEADLKHHKKGLPDLICFDTKAKQFELIEVKSPNDTLQEQQRLWLQHFHEHGIKAKVCRVNWQT